LIFRISQVSVVTHLRFGKKYDMSLVTNLLVGKFRKVVKAHRVAGLVFMDHRVA